MLKGYPPIPAAPVLNAIANVDGDGNYTVSWNASANATSYLLQEDDNAAFSSPETRYSGAGTSWDTTGKAVGAYHYRAQASNTSGTSGWSGPQSVTVSSTQSSCPAAGAWAGTTNLGKDISFSVSSTPTCQVKPLKITVYVWTCGFPGTREDTVTWWIGFQIVDNHFTTGPAGHAWPEVIGSFTSPTTATGTWTAIGDVGCLHNSHGTWTASQSTASIGVP